jgi:hypothetical protein
MLTRKRRMLVTVALSSKIAPIIWTFLFLAAKGDRTSIGAT